MNPEIKAKVNEILKANGKRELSLDDMDKVNGGASWDTINVYGAEMTEAEFNNMMLTMTEQFGFSVAMEVFQDVTGLGKGAAVGSGISAKTDKGAMNVVLHDFWYMRKVSAGQ
jgi:hypothetical protein